VHPSKYVQHRKFNFTNKESIPFFPLMPEPMEEMYAKLKAERKRRNKSARRCHHHHPNTASLSMSFLNVVDSHLN
jgi:hypothetical protein